MGFEESEESARVVVESQIRRTTQQLIHCVDRSRAEDWVKHVSALLSRSVGLERKLAGDEKYKGSWPLHI